MTLQEIYTALVQNGLLTDSELNLSSEDAGRFLSNGIADMLQANYPGGTLKLKLSAPVPAPIQGQKALIPAGNIDGDLFGLTSPAATAWFFVDSANEAALSLPVSIGKNGWKFIDSFNFPSGTVLDSLVFNDGLFIFQSVKQDITGKYPWLDAGLNFYGNFNPGAFPFANISWMFSAVEKVNLSGLITMPSGSAPEGSYPGLDLSNKGSDLDASFSFGSVSVHLWIDLVTSQSAPGAANFTAELALHSDLKVGDKNVPFAAIITDSYPGLFFLEGNVNDLVIGGLDDLIQYAEGTSLGALIPGNFKLGNLLELSDFRILIAASAREVMNVRMGVKLKDTFEGTGWTLIPNLFYLKNVSTDFNVIQPFDKEAREIQVAFNGRIGITDDIEMDVSVLLPEQRVEGTLVHPFSLGDLIKKVFGDSIPIPSKSFMITQLGVGMDLKQKTYSIGATLGESWELNLGPFQIILANPSFNIVRSSEGIYAMIAADLTLFDTQFYISANNQPGAKGWTFRSVMAPGEEITLDKVAKQFLGYTPELPDNLNPAITQFEASFDTGQKTYAVATAIHWPLELGGQNFAIDAAVSIASSRTTPEAEPALSGQVSGSFSFNNLKLEAIYKFSETSKEIIFKFGKVIADYVKNTSEGKVTEEKILISFGDLTLGEILEFIINLAAKDKDFKLGSPWDVLNSINLKNLTLEVDLLNKAIQIEYAVSKDFGFIDLKSVGIRYQKQYGKSKVNLLLKGKFLDQDYTKEPLTWDVLNDPPPSTTAGSSKFELRYLGLGQRVSLREGSDLTSVTKVITQLQNALKPVDDPSKSPVAQLPGIAFNANSDWLIGTSMTVAGFVDLDIVFNDPVVYGLLLKLGGQKAGKMAGLSFEILYRKVTDDIGVYHIELTLPDAFRHLQFGAVSVTLPIVVVDIYTNGNFKVDFGFPPSITDFSRSFSVEAFPFIGYGGFYFAYLNGATSSRVPQISNGKFDPVIEFGLALSIGLGKTFTMGPFNAGISVTVVGILEGSFAWFIPDSKNQDSELYYWIQGTIGIVGKVWGSVDFGIVKASVSLIVYAKATITVEAYKAIPIELEAGVSVSVSVKIVFVRIHFRFHATIRQKFTVGSDSTPPWQIKSGNDKKSPLKAAARTAELHHSAANAASAFAAAAVGRPEVATGTALTENFTSARRMAARMVPADVVDAKITVDLTLTTLFSKPLASDILLHPATPPADAPETQVSMSALLFIKNDVPTGVSSTAAAINNSAATDNSPFNMLSERLLKWSFGIIGANPADGVSAADLMLMHMALESVTETDTYFSYDNLKTFFENNVTFHISLRPTSSTDEMSAAFFPMIPALTLDTSTNISADYGDFKKVGKQYEQDLAEYFQMLMVDYENRVEESGGGVGAAFRMETPDDESMATWVFRNYFLMLTRSMVRGGMDAMESYRHTIRSGDSIAGVTGVFGEGDLGYVVQGGDTLDGIAEQFGITLEALQEANPNMGPATLKAGLFLYIPYAVEVQDVLVANQTVSGLFNTGATFTLSGVKHQVRSGDTLNTLSADLKGLLQLNADSEDILTRGSEIPLGNLSYTLRDGDSLASLAKYYGLSEKAITDANPGKPVQPGQDFILPDVIHKVQGGFLVPYTFVDNETLDSVITTYYGTLDEFDKDELIKHIQRLNPNTTLTGTIPNGTLVDLPYSDTFARLLIYYRITTDQFVQALQSLPSDGTHTADNTKLLAPLAEWELPPFTYTLQDSDTIESIARQFALSMPELAQNGDFATNTTLLKATEILKIPAVPMLSFDGLMGQMKDTGALNNASGMVSRFHLHGLRVPDPANQDFRNWAIGDHTDPFPAGVATFPLFSMTGQTFEAPPAETEDFSFTLNNSQSLEWITFEAPPTEGAEPPEPPKSITLHLCEEEEKTLKAYAVEDFTFKPGVHSLGRAPLYSYVPPRAALMKALDWQAASLNSFSGMQARPVILPFPSGLTAKLAAEGGGLLMEVAATSRGNKGSRQQDTDIEKYVWSSTVDINVSKVTDPATGKDVEGVYELFGADNSGMKVLFSLMDQLKNDQADLYLMFPPDPSGSNPAGYASGNPDRSGTILIKTNLSTESHSAPPRARAALRMAEEPAAPPSPYVANLTPEQSAQFVELLWECSVVKTGGYYLRYQDADGEGLPGYIFESSGPALLTLQVVLHSQNKDKDHRILPCNNSVTLAEAIDLSEWNVYAQSLTHRVQKKDTLESVAAAYPADISDPLALATVNADIRNLILPGVTLDLPDSKTYVTGDYDTFASIVKARSVNLADLVNLNKDKEMFRPGQYMQFQAGQLQMHSSVPAGNAGFLLRRDNPEITNPSGDPYQQEIDNLFNLLGFSINSHNTGFDQSPEGLPVGPADSDFDAEAPPEEDESIWMFETTFSTFKSAKPAFNFSPENAALPDHTLNPYAGISVTNAADNKLNLDLSFHDLLGDKTVANGFDGALTLEIGYYDDLIPPSRFPATVWDYHVTGTGGDVKVEVRGAFRMTNFLPAGGTGYEDVVRSVRVNRVQLSDLYYQVNQPDYGISLTASFAGFNDLAAVQSTAMRSLRNYVRGAYIFLNGILETRPYQYKVKEGEKLGEIANAHSITPGDLMSANGSLTITSFFGTDQVTFPDIYTFNFGNSLDDLSTEHQISVADILSFPVNYERANLQSGTPLLTATRTYSVESDNPETLVAIASQMNSNAGLIAGENGDAKLTEGLVLTVEGYTATVEANDTLNLMVPKFPNVPDVDAAFIGVANGLIEGLFAGGQNLNIRHYLIREGESLQWIADNIGTQSSGGSSKVEDLLNDNMSVKDIFRAGERLYVGSKTEPAQAEDTLYSFTARESLNFTDLAVTNEDAVLPTALDLELDMLLDTAGLTGAFYVNPGEKTAADIAALFGLTDAAALAALNRYLPGLFKAGTSLDLNGHQHQLTDSDTFDNLPAVFGMDFAAFANAAGSVKDIWATGGFFVTPAPTTGGDADISLSAVAGKYGLNAADLAGANASTLNFLKSGQELNYLGETLTVGPFQTLNGIVSELVAAGKPADVLDLATANPGMKLNSDILLLPAVPAILVSEGISPALPARISEVKITVDLSRDVNYVDPEFKESASVYAVSSAVPPRSAGAGSGESRSLRQFAADFEAAIPGVKVGTSESAGANAESSATRMWVVDFREASGFRYSIEPEKVQYYALAPLSTKLWSVNDIDIREYLPNGTLSAPTPKSFRAVDPDVFARSFLNFMDLMLSPAYAVHIRELAPADLDTLIGYKGDLAEAIKQQVQGILDPPKNLNASEGLEKAKEALRQQLLISLSEAYQTDVILQFPFNVTAGSESEDTAPRLSGKPVARTYITGEKDGFPELNSYYQVNEDYLATILENIPYILNNGATVTFDDKSHLLKDGDTLETLVHEFGLGSVTELVSGLKVEDGKGLFLAYVRINVTRVDIPVTISAPGGTPTFLSVADYAGTTVNEVFFANRYLKGIFEAGTAVNIDGHSATAEATDSLDTMGGKLGIPFDELAVAFWKADVNRNNAAPAYTLSGSAELRMMQITPAVSISTGKVPLSQGESYNTVLLNINKENEMRSVFMDMEYSIVEMEHELQDKDDKGYQDSSWLNFILPPATDFAGNRTDAGQLQIPVPLRSYPVSPRLEAQSWAKSDSNAVGIDALRDWDYSFDLKGGLAAQDQVEFTLIFNSTKTDAVTALASDPNPLEALFAALVQFAEVQAPLMSTLSKLSEARIQEDDKELLTTAIGTFTTLAGGIRTAWLNQLMAMLRRNVPEVQKISYRLQPVTDDADPGRFSALKAEILPGSTAGKFWPDLYDLSTGKLLEREDSDDYALYTWDHTIALPYALQAKVPDLNVIDKQNGWSSVHLTRNEGLLSTRSTNNKFVYHTPKVMFPSQVIPYVISDKYTDLATFSPTQPATLPEALKGFFKQLFIDGVKTPMESYNIEISASFGYLLVDDGQSQGIPDAGSVITRVPILFTPQFAYTPPEGGLGADSFIDELVASLDKGRDFSGLMGTGGMYIIDLTVYSSIYPDSNMPLLRISDLIYMEPAK